MQQLRIIGLSLLFGLGAGCASTDGRAASSEVSDTTGPMERMHEASESTSAIGMRGAYLECMDATGGVVPAGQACIDEEAEFQQSRISAAEDRLQARVSPAGWEAYQVRKRAWEARRPERCPWDAATEGQAQRLAANDCLLEELARWAHEIEQQVK